ncbi:hypothetical protein WMF20_35380 [Sorangium sp. So ce834]|uniref:hypothetical protein n=1 Tax=Sorangium sp. So ce834 TaxID=3133321 RepID=UPI003F5F039F
MAGSGDQTARFAVELDAKGGDKARDLANALSGLRDKIKADQSAVAELQSALRRLQGGGQTNTEVFKKLRDQLTAKKAALASAQEQYVKLGGTFGPVASGASVANAGLSNLISTVTGSGDPVSGLIGRGQQLTAILGKAGVYGAIIMVTVALVGLTVAAVAAVAQLAAYSLQAANAARDTRLLFDAVDVGSGAGQRLGVQVELLAERVNLARGQLNEMALALGRTRLQGRALEAAFSAVATTTAVMGQAAGSTLQSIATEAARTRVFMLGAFSLDGTGLKVADVAAQLAKRLGVSMKAATEAIRNGRVRVSEGLAALDAAVQAKFGKIATAQMLSFDVQMKRARENVGAIFKDVKIEPFLEALRDVLRLFDRNTVAGQQLKFIAETFLNPIFDTARAVSPFVQGMFKGMIIGALLVAITVQRLKKAFDDAFGSSTKSKIDWVKVGMYVGVAAVMLLGAALLSLVPIAGLIALSFLPLGVLVGVIVAGLVLAMVAVGAAVFAVYAAFRWAYQAIASLDFAELGTRLVDGLVFAITGGVGRLVGAVKRLGSSAVSALRSVWDVNSPSRVSAKITTHFVEGSELALEHGTAGVEAASRGLASAAVDGLDGMQAGPGVAAAARGGDAPKPARGPGAGRAGMVLHVEHLEINGVKDADELTSRKFLVRLVDVLEGAATSGGIPINPEPA